MRSIGIASESEEQDNPANSWFYSPETITATLEAEITQKMHNEDDVRENIIAFEDDREQQLHVVPNPEVCAHLTHLAESDKLVENVGVSNINNVPGKGCMHNGTLIARMLESTDTLTWNTVTHIRSWAKQNKYLNSIIDYEPSNDAGIFDDVGLFIKEPGGKAQWK